MSDVNKKTKIPNRTIKLPINKNSSKESNDISENAYLSCNNLKKNVFNNLKIVSSNDFYIGSVKYLKENKFKNVSINFKNISVPSPLMINSKIKKHEPTLNDNNNTKEIHFNSNEDKINNIPDQPNVKNLDLHKIPHGSLNSLIYKTDFSSFTSSNKISFDKSSSQINKLLIKKKGNFMQTNKKDEFNSQKMVPNTGKTNGVKNLHSPEVLISKKVDNLSDNKEFHLKEIETRKEFVQLDIDSFNHILTEISILKSTISKLYSFLENLNILSQEEIINEIKLFKSEDNNSKKMQFSESINCDYKNMINELNNSEVSTEWQSNKMLNCWRTTNLMASSEEEDFSTSINSDIDSFPIQSYHVTPEFYTTDSKLNSLQNTTYKYDQLEEDLLKCGIHDIGSVKVDDKLNKTINNNSSFTVDNNLPLDEFTNNCKITDSQLYISENVIYNNCKNSQKNLIGKKDMCSNHGKNENLQTQDSLNHIVKTKPVKFISKLPFFARSKENKSIKMKKSLYSNHNKAFRNSCLHQIL